MKKLLLGFLMLLIGQLGFGQTVSDNAVIPVSVTLNSILRLTVTSGGNIQFVFTTIDHYTNGIANTTRYDTQFTVSSSRDYTVTMVPDNATHFTGLEAGTSTVFTNNNVGYALTGQGVSSAGALRGLDATEDIIDAGTAGANKQYTIHWECGTSGALTMNTNSLLTESYPADVYVQNIFLTLIPN